jgi:hypothetical protein
MIFFLNLSQYLKKHNKKAIIAIDEVQQIITIKEKNIEPYCEPTFKIFIISVLSSVVLKNIF